ncbi:hypothetical protein M4I33_06010 [Clostridium sp. LY3-2]|uniref:hypothetical protein n=1 Tax=Clostridium sp. LY3-2 TaxID=2942482 RepID=UPI002153987A|nr:hypothetical protein [Clostridium sp. LY3-2]MCR6514436.1 hypothetical protein [Clostridium sp. LY3-2]
MKSEESIKKKLLTWGGKSEFSYIGSIKLGTVIYYGNDNCVSVTKEQYKDMLEEFNGSTVPIGTSRNKASGVSLGYWLQENITKTAIASYVGKILLYEGYAIKVESGSICFK